ncbi:MAG: phage holin family protein [Acidimicrobiales bacterium]
MAVPSRSTDPSRGPAPAATPDADWPEQATDGIIRLVDSVRDKTTGPALQIARGIKYGVTALIFGTVVAFMLVIGLIRALEVIFINVFHLENPIWLVYLIVGLVFVGLGALLWGKARTTPPPA